MLRSRLAALSPEARASLFHATVYSSGGVLSAYFAVWMSDRGIAPSEMGVVNAMPTIIVLLTGVLIGRLADRAGDWRVAVAALALISGVASLGVAWAGGFWSVLLVFTLASTPVTAMIPVIDAATLRLTQRRGTDFGVIRAWATVGFVVWAALTGLAIDHFGVAAFLPLFVGASLLRAVAGLQLPRFRAPGHADQPKPATPHRLGALLKPWFILPCVAYALINATHVFVSVMGALIFKADGIGEGWFGPLSAYSAVGEAAAMFLWSRIGPNLSARGLLVASGGVAALRWVGMGLSPTLPWAFALQTLHFLTYPFSYFGLMHFIADWAPEEIAAEAQGFASTLAQGASVATFLGFGWLVGQIGGHTYFVASAMCVVAVAATLTSMRLMTPHRRGEGEPGAAPTLVPTDLVP